MRFEELQDDNDDDEWAAALIQAAEAAEEEEWEWRIAMARARVEREEPREEPRIAKLTSPPPAPPANQASPPPSAHKGAPKPPPIPPRPPRAETIEPLPVMARRRLSVSTEAPPSAPRARTETGPLSGAMSRGVSLARIPRPPVIIPPKEPRRLACGTGGMQAYEDSGDLLREAFAAYVTKED